VFDDLSLQVVDYLLISAQAVLFEETLVDVNVSIYSAFPTHWMPLKSWQLASQLKASSVIKHPFVFRQLNSIGSGV
jgi:hypothetical protein